MSFLRLYKRKPNKVTAVRFDLLGEIKYLKWGGEQTGNPGCWLVCNDGDTYTIDAETFAATYEKVSLGVYTKTGRVSAKEAKKDGAIATKEGVSQYKAGDMIVYNTDETHGYCVGAEKFNSMYELISP